MGKYTQDGRPISINTPLGKDALLLEKISGIEGVSRLYEFRLDLLAEKSTLDQLNEKGQANLFNKLLGQLVTVAFQGPSGAARTINGIVNRLTQAGRLRGLNNTFLVRLEAELVPRMWLLTQRRQSRVFQNMSATAIVLQILKQEWGLNVSGLEPLLAAVPTRALCVQYRESDFDFVNRLLEEEGLSYYFASASPDDQIVVGDGLLNPPAIGTPATVPFDDETGVASSRVFTWKKSQEVCPSLTTLRDFNFELPGTNGPVFQDLKDSWPALKSVQVGTLSQEINHSVKSSSGGELLEDYEYPGGFAKPFDSINREGQENDVNQPTQQNAKRLARLRMEARVAQSLFIAGGANLTLFRPGSQFTLDKHFLDGDGAYLLTEVEHSADISGSYSTSDYVVPNDYYHNRFYALPCHTSLPFRPLPATARPHIEGAQTAVVVGPTGEEIEVDKYGRIRVQFTWDRPGPYFVGDSCWVRVVQFWAGKNWGAFFWPRVGQEVVVVFEDGDPDRPLIVGSVYSAANPAPVDLPTEAELAGIKSCIFTKDPNSQFNAIVFHDNPGVEYVQIFSNRNEMRSCTTNHYQNVPQGSFHFNGNI